MPGHPRVTVLMPVFNGERYLREAIESILRQSFADFEFLIINDGSTDGTVEIIYSFKDSRIRLVHNEANLGLIATLNKGIELAHGEYIARMDCDDISLPRRLEEQTTFMEEHRGTAVCGTAFEVFGIKRRRRRYPCEDPLIRAHLMFENAFAHPSVMMRREFFWREKLQYDESYAHAEDYDLWTRVPAGHTLANLDRVLLKYRMHQEQVTLKRFEEQLAVANLIRRRQLTVLGIEPSDQELLLHEKIATRKVHNSLDFLDAADRWLQTICRENSASLCYYEDALRQTTGLFWWESCFSGAGLGLKAVKRYYSSPLAGYARISSKYMGIFLLKCVLRINERS